MRSVAVPAIVMAAALFGTWPALAQIGPERGPGLLQGGPTPGPPQDAWREPEDKLHAKGLTSCTVGDRVSVSFEGQWLAGEVIAVDWAAPYPCKVHMIGQPPSTDASFAAWMLRPAAASR